MTSREKEELLGLARKARVGDDDALVEFIERTDPPTVTDLVEGIFPGSFRSALTPRQFNRLWDHLELCRDLREHARLSAAS